MNCMADTPKRTAKDKPAAKGRGPVVFMTLDSDTDAALESFIADQTIPPDRAPVALKALREFLSKHGYFPPKKPRA